MTMRVTSDLAGLLLAFSFLAQPATATTSGLSGCDLILDPPTSEISMRFLDLEADGAAVPFEETSEFGSIEKRQLLALAVHASEARRMLPRRGPDRRQVLSNMRANSKKVEDSRPSSSAAWGFGEFSYLMTYFDGGFAYNRVVATRPLFLSVDSLYPEPEDLVLVKARASKTLEPFYLLVHGSQAKSKRLLIFDPIEARTKIYSAKMDRDGGLALSEMSETVFVSPRGRLQVEDVLQIRRRAKTSTPVSDLIARVKELTAVVYDHSGLFFPGTSNLTKNQIKERILSLVNDRDAAIELVESLSAAALPDPQRHAEIIELNWELRMYREAAERLKFETWLGENIVSAPAPANTVSLGSRPLTVAQARTRLNASQSARIEAHIRALKSVGSVPAEKWTHVEVTVVSDAIRAYETLVHELEDLLPLRANIDRALSPLFLALQSTIERQPSGLDSDAIFVLGLLVKKDWESLRRSTNPR
jgi:hypothetical protein